MKITALLLSAALIAGSASSASAAAAGGESFDFLLMDGGARASSLGGAYTSLASNSAALFYNPAGLGLVKAHEISLMHNKYVEGLSQQQAAFASKSGFGASLNYLDFGGIERTTLSRPDGTLGTFGLSDLALGAGYGRAFFEESLSLGLGGKYLRESVDGLSVSGYALDVGGMAAVQSIPGLSFGLAALNMGPEVRFSAQKEKLPLTVRGGASYRFAAGGTQNTFALDLFKVRSDKVRAGAGVESVLGQRLALRAGYCGGNDAGLGIVGGAGFLWQAMSVDYAFVPFGDLGFAHRLSLTFRWGREESEADRQPQSRRPLEPEATAEQRFARAEKAIRSKDWDSAAGELAAVDRLLESQDRRRILYYERMGIIALRRGAPERAKTFFTEAIEFASTLGVKDNGVADAYAGMGECLLGLGKDAYARKFLEKALKIGPSPEIRRNAESLLKRLSASEESPR